MIVYKAEARGNAGKERRLGFSVWARSEPKDYLGCYPRAVEQIKQKNGVENLHLIAIVDDIWPAILMDRTSVEQEAISQKYQVLLPKLGFGDVVLTSEFVDQSDLLPLLHFSTRVTNAEFVKLLPRSKSSDGTEIEMGELVGFLWHMHVLNTSIEMLSLDGFVAGIRSEYFYLIARKLLRPHSTYFVETT